MKKIIIMLLAVSLIGFSAPKKIFKSQGTQNSKESTVKQAVQGEPTANGKVKTQNQLVKERRIDVNKLKQRFFTERVEIYRKSPKASLEIFKQFDVAFINFFNATSEKDQIKYSKQLNNLVIKYSDILPKPIPNEYFLCETVLDVFSVKNLK